MTPKTRWWRDYILTTIGASAVIGVMYTGGIMERLAVVLIVMLPVLYFGHILRDAIWDERR